MNPKSSAPASRKRRATGDNDRSGSDDDNDGNTAVTTAKSNNNSNTNGNTITAMKKYTADTTVYSTHDPACDACRFKKIKCDRETPSCLNCNRGELRCVYSDRGKRTNYTKRLIEDLGDVSSRLERLEDAVERCVNMVESIAINSPGSGNSSHVLDYQTNEGLESNSQSSSDTRHRSSSAESGYIMRGVDGNERYHGSSSMHQLFRKAQSALDDQLKQLPGSENVSYDDLMMQLTTIGGDNTTPNEHTSQVDLSHDKLPLTRPPKGLLDALIEPYFQQTNPVFPIFSRESFLINIEQNYSAASNITDSAWLLAFNNVTLQSLSAKSRSTRKVHEQPHLSAMDAELIKPFLLNSRRAFAHMDVLLKPRLINVQALVSFCLVAIDNFQIETAELLLEQACQVARSMGLHQQTPNSEGQSYAEIQERRNVFWSLSVLDKHFSLLTGRSSCLPSYDCDVLAPEPEPGNKLQKYFLARISLALIQERIYVSLYSAKAIRRADGQSQSLISKLDADLRHWYEGVERSLTDAKSDMTSSECVLAVEMEFLYYNSCVMVHRRSFSAPDKLQCLKEARQCLDLLQTLNNVPRVEKDAAVRRSFQLYPFAAYSELFSNLIKSSPPAFGDLEVLHGTLGVLRDVAVTDNLSTYIHRLYVATSRCTAMAADFVQRNTSAPQKKPTVRRKLTPPPSKKRTSTRTSPPRISPQRSPPSQSVDPAVLEGMHLDPRSQVPIDHYYQITSDNHPHPHPLSPRHYGDMVASVPSYDLLNRPLVPTGPYNSFDPSHMMTHDPNHAMSGTMFHDGCEERLSPFPSLDDKDGWMGMSMPLSENMFESWTMNNDTWANRAV